MRLIKTYTNGRFYDTCDKKYISKDQLAALINKKEALKVIMHQTNKDVTRSIAKQLGVLLDAKKESKLNIDNLKNWVSDQVDRRIEQAIALINLPTREQIRRLTADIETLAKQVDSLQTRLVKAQPPVKTAPGKPAEPVQKPA